ncbi:MAG TPA: hypothetical protein VJC39_00365 [Candidatus Nanoarchaeia archaeon]|nr:hypothetical protein [Candidatus Nanoarchaeia archaeon]
MKKETHAKLTKGLHILSFIVVVIMLIWNLYSPSGWAVLEGGSSEAALVDYTATTWIFLTLILVVLSLNYLLKLLKK